ncbi:ATP-binding cassette, subfamily B/ATP-binding cassette, subfamily C [Nocardiopsis flavescens]|uniref:ATP-binding cassette, subfamily B/ATP-binding cassette, subfamily C n=1 Tax=Nocardiopsis flavescens TaxID=758803 RepID=A0A1M6UB93_9ACTN|nr:ABC transporter ATP-binding protein [Nocardiopsis flavescens]SHK66440.1 ATP-binding cassette, subfamily B/ATP-binding cassette, subfamily C [Nocardiopsis flavescens]
MRAHDAAENDAEDAQDAGSGAPPDSPAGPADAAGCGPPAEPPPEPGPAGGAPPPGAAQEDGRAGDPDPEELASSHYRVFQDRARQATWWAMARRMPALVGRALVLGWRAGPGDLAATAVFGLGMGAATAWALVATNAVLEEVFAAVPTADRVQAALPSLALLAAALVARGACGALAGRAQARLEPRVVLAAERRFNEAVTEVEVAAFDDSDFNDRVFRGYATGCDQRGNLVRTSVDALTGLLGIAAAAGVLGSMHPVLLPLILVAMLPQWWGSAAAARLRYRLTLRLTRVMRRKFMLQNLMIDRRTAAELRSYTMGPRLRAEFDRFADRELEARLRLATRMALIQVTGGALGGIATGVVFAALGLLLVQGVIPLAAAGAAVVAVRVAQGALGTVLVSVNQVYEAGLYVADLEELEETARARTPRRGLAPAPQGFARIRVQDVTFTYPRGADDDGDDAPGPALAGVDLELPRGRTVALVGENGSGKSTLAKLLSGLYAPDTGRVCWDGTDLARVDPEDLRARIAVIAQDHTHWPMTARQNVVMSGPEGEPERLARAAGAAHADTVVADLPRGWETLLDKRFARGHEPSGGQWQRLAAARGFHRGDDGAAVPLLIADEPTSALDARAEHRFFTSLHAHAGRTGATVVLITHRLASVRMADVIVVLERGRVVAQGSHGELMERGGVYRELWELQARAYRDDAAGAGRAG